MWRMIWILVHLHRHLPQQFVHQRLSLPPLLLQQWRHKLLMLLSQELLMPRLLLLDHHHILFQLSHFSQIQLVKYGLTLDQTGLLLHWFLSSHPLLLFGGERLLFNNEGRSRKPDCRSLLLQLVQHQLLLRMLHKVQLNHWWRGMLHSHLLSFFLAYLMYQNILLI